MESNTQTENKCEILREALLLQEHRVESFKSWPFDDDSTCSKLKMAEAGFYWTGTRREPDTATCFVCNKTLDGWEKTDEPWKEHAKHAPQCLFVKNGLPQNEISVRQLFDICRSVIKAKVSREAEIVKSDLQKDSNTELENFCEKKH